MSASDDHDRHFQVRISDVFNSHTNNPRAISTRHDLDIHVSEATYEHIGYFAAGGIASITSRTTTAPLDRLKVYLIAESSSDARALQYARKGALVQASGAALINFGSACRSIWQAGGMRSLWAGNGLNIVKMLPEGAIKFGTYEAVKRAFARWEGVKGPEDISVWAQTASGGLGGVAAQLAAYPIDTLRFRMQCEMKRGGIYGMKLMSTTAKKMWTQGGIRAYFRGLLWGLIGQYPYSAIDLTTFEYTKRWYIRSREAQGFEGDDARPSAPVTAAIGGFSGAFGASLVWPLNLLRTRLQTCGTVLHPQVYTGIVDVTQKTIQQEGWRGLFKGITPNLIKVVPAVAITYTVYEQSKRALGLP